MRGGRRARGGFTLAELLLIMVVLSILAGVALPTMRKAIDRADAAKIMTDIRNVSMAVRTYIENTGVLPDGEQWGVLPPDLVPYLPESGSFGYKTTEYRLVTQANQGSVRLEIRYPNSDPIGIALQRFTGADFTWTNTRTTVWIQR
ncbi:MAG: prepilin-type N-terminal cleavage/methylation domain-containing protein [Longimicrobiales bacterium]|nr:prepilin-type N-terminal cleavage/methylation domain-containing protein [Longimicrobiales bacterium]